MSFRRKHSFQKPGLPDLAALIVMIVVLVMVSLWWKETQKPQWTETTGRVLRGDITPTHYNAENFYDKVHIQFEYDILGSKIIREWTGVWPHDDSPNALPDDQMNELLRSGHPLRVFYDPANPEQWRLHGGTSDLRSIYSVLVVLSLVGSIYFGLRVYPSWKRRRSFTELL